MALMATHPNARERQHIRLTQWILTAVGLATLAAIILLAIRGDFRKVGPPSSAAAERQYH
jgi:hypothetical protein